MSAFDTRKDLMLPNVLNYYERTEEVNRLKRIESELEMFRTRDILSRHLPPAPAVILDVGGGPAVHSFWLAAQHYEVHLVDIVPIHIDQAHAAEKREGKLASITLGDARELKFADANVDAVVMLGPLYHLTRRNDRIKALREAYRVL